MNSTLKLSRHLSHQALAFRIFYLCFIILCISGSVSARRLSKEPAKINLQEMVSSSIQLNKKTIQASSLEDQLFPLLISSKVNKIDDSTSARNPVDLVYVLKIENERYYGPIKTQIKEIQNLLKHHLLPLMTDQDRLAVVLWYDSFYFDDLLEVIYAFPITKLPSLTTTAPQNWEEIILSINENILKDDLPIDRALQVAWKILAQRNETNRTTGVFIWAPDREVRCPNDGKEEGIMFDIDRTKDSRWIVQIFEGELKDQAEVFAESLAALRTGVVETKFLLKPEESELLKGVEIQRTYPWLPGVWSFGENGTSTMRRLSVKLGLEEEFFFDLKIPKITQGLLSSPVEVKVATFQVIFVLEDGSQVVKNEDLIVRIVGEGEKLVVEEEESKEAVRNFHHKWGKDWLLPIEGPISEAGRFECAKTLLKRYKESLDGSSVKDDEMLQNMLKETEKRVLEDKESGLSACWHF